MGNEDGFAGLLEHREYDAVLGGLVGLIIGDALGCPYEFHSPESLPRRDEMEMAPPPWFNRSHAGVPPATWSDDGAQALCLLASLLEQGRFSLVDFSTKLLQWLDAGYMAIDGNVFDVGIQTQEALQRIREGVPSLESGGKSEWDNGNGSLMRVLPLALWHSGSDEGLVQDAHLQSIPTHAHPRSWVACGYFCLVARAYLGRLAEPWSWADHQLRGVYEDWSDEQEGRDFLNELDVLQNYPKTATPSGSGYVIDTIWSVRKALEETTYEDVVRSAVLMGNDTDTTAAVAGALAGIRDGIRGIPKRWLAQLRGFEIVEPMIPPFLIRMKGGRNRMRQKSS